MGRALPVVALLLDANHASSWMEFSRSLERYYDAGE